MKILIPKLYETVFSSVEHGYKVLRHRICNRYYFVDSSLNLILKMKFRSVKRFTENLLLVQREDEKWNIIKENDMTFFIEKWCEAIYDPFKEEGTFFLVKSLTSDMQTRFNAVRKCDGTFISYEWFDVVNEDDGIIKVIFPHLIEDGEPAWNCIKPDGTLFSDKNFFFITPFNDGLAWAHVSSEMCILLNENGENIFGREFPIYEQRKVYIIEGEICILILNDVLIHSGIYI